MEESQGTGTLISRMSDVVHLLPCRLAEQRNPVTNRRASHFLKTGASRNNHAVEPRF